MCIKVVRYYCCPIPTDSLSDDTDFNPTSNDYVSFHDFTEDRVVPFEWLNADLPQYEDFTYVFHNVVSWIRCAAWNNRHCTLPNAPLPVRRMLFRRVCPSCCGYDKCLSKQTDAFLAISGLETSVPVSEAEQETWLRDISRRAFERALRTETARYQHLGLPFDISEAFPKRWKGLMGKQPHDVPFVHAIMCVEEPEHMGPYIDEHYNVDGFIECDCPASEFMETANPLRAAQKRSANAFVVEPNFNDYVQSLLDCKFFKRNQIRHSTAAKELEWLGWSSDRLHGLPDRRDTWLGSFQDTMDAMRPRAADLLRIETHGERPYLIPGGMQASTIIEKRKFFAMRVANLLLHDPGFPEETLPHLTHLLRLMMLPWSDGNTGIRGLDENWLPNEDLTVMRAFIEAVDKLTESQYWRATLAYLREDAVLSEYAAVAQESESNLKAVHDVFFTNTREYYVSSQVTQGLTEECPVCTGGWAGSSHHMPEHWQAVKMPCCGKVMHAGCLQGSMCKHPNKRKPGTCPMCRANMRDHHGWFLSEGTAGSVSFFRDSPDYETLEGFFPSDLDEYWENRLRFDPMLGPDWVSDSGLSEEQAQQDPLHHQDDQQLQQPNTQAADGASSVVSQDAEGEYDIPLDFEAQDAQGEQQDQESYILWPRDDESEVSDECSENEL